LDVGVGYLCLVSTETLSQAEVWKPIPEWEGLYEVSNQGRVRSYTRWPEGRLLNPWLSTHGYPTVNLAFRGKSKRRGVHVFVAEAFIGPRPKRNVINHKDSTPTNNYVGNLEYCTQRQNITHALRAGRMAVGEKHRSAKLTEKTVRSMLELRGTKTQREIAEQFGVREKHVWKILQRKTWKHVSDEGCPPLKKCTRRGESVGNSKLTEEIVRTIRQLSKSIPPQMIAEQLQLEYATVRGVVIRKSWAHID
jgi:lambda repressor-like predicted transcriptional regulator